MNHEWIQATLCSVMLAVDDPLKGSLEKLAEAINRPIIERAKLMDLTGKKWRI